MLALLRDDDHAVFVYTPTKEGHHALDFFTLGTDSEGQPIRWKGTITADALSAHDCLFADGSRTEAGCHAHGLRKFLNNWEALTRFLEAPEGPLDNNWSERALRSVNLIRDNSLYAGGEEGAVRLCTLLTVIGTCWQIGVDPYRYIEWALSRVVPHRANRGLTAGDLTPHAYKATEQAGAK